MLMSHPVQRALHEIRYVGSLHLYHQSYPAIRADTPQAKVFSSSSPSRPSPPSTSSRSSANRSSASRTTRTSPSSSSATSPISKKTDASPAHRPLPSPNPGATPPTTRHLPVVAPTSTRCLSTSAARSSGRTTRSQPQPGLDRRETESDTGARRSSTATGDDRDRTGIRGDEESERACVTYYDDDDIPGRSRPSGRADR